MQGLIMYSGSLHEHSGLARAERTNRIPKAEPTGFGFISFASSSSEGLPTFSTLEEAVDGVNEIKGNYVKHARATREIAVEYFHSDKIVTQLLADLGI